MRSSRERHIPFSGNPNTRKSANTPITCDQCEYPIPMSGAITERPVPDRGVVMELQCPSCGALYPIARISETGLRLRTRLHRLERLGQTGTPQYRAIRDRYRKQVTPLAR